MGSAHVVGGIPEAGDTQVLGRMTA